MSALDGIRTIEDLDLGPEGAGGELAGKRVLVRVDLDVPLRGDEVLDDAKVRAVLPTVRALVDLDAKVVLASHRTRTDGKVSAACTLEPAGTKLAELTGWEVHLPDDCLGDAAKKVIRDLRTGGAHHRGAPQICLLENLRLHPGEEQNDDAFARALGELADVYVNDAFGLLHRSHASVHALPRLTRERAAGKALIAEIAAVERLTEAPARPVALVLGGERLSDKLGLLEALLGRIDVLVIGGAVANTFLAAQGHKMRASRFEPERLAQARTILNKAREARVEVVLPTDLVVAEGHRSEDGKVVRAEAVPDGLAALDVGPASRERMGRALARAKTVLWNGPMGVCENTAFAEGTRQLASLLAQAGGFSLLAGVETTKAFRRSCEPAERPNVHLSDAAEALFAWLEGKKLPALEALRRPG